jgi:hypothetical protein
LRVVLLILLGKAPGMLARIARPTAMRLAGGIG